LAYHFNGHNHAGELLEVR